MHSRPNPFLGRLTIEPYMDGSFVLHAWADNKRGEEPARWAFSTVSDLMAFLSKASGAVVNPMQPSFDFREHLKGDPAHGPAS